MDWYTVGWLAWMGMFLCLELPALANRRDGDTLSEHVWKWFRVLDSRHTALTWTLRGVLLLFLGWLFLHLGFGWLTPTHPAALEVAMSIKMFAKYRKFWVAAAGVAAVLLKAYADGHVDPAEWGEVAIAAATALGVVAVPNKQDPGTPQS